MQHSSVIFIIPARGGSKRLPRKNVLDVCGKPMITWAIEACKKSAYYRDNNLFVSTEDPEIISISYNAGASVIVRPEHLAYDHVWTQDVLEHAADKISLTQSFDYVVRVQANSPQVTFDKIDECLTRIFENKLYEVFTVNRDSLVEDGAIHVMKEECVRQHALSVYKGVVLTNYIDIHTKDDLDKTIQCMS